MIELLIYPLLAGVLLCCATGPLGCFVVWRKMAYFGDTIAHASLLGVALGVLLRVNVLVALIASCVVLATFIATLQRSKKIAADTLLGVIAHGSLAAGLLLISSITAERIDLNSVLLGDLLTISRTETIIFGGLTIFCLAFFAAQWKGLLLFTIDSDLSQIERGPGLQGYRFQLAILTALVIAIGVNLVGVLLISALLLIPAATARSLSGSPESMAIIATILGVISVITGLISSVYFNAAPGPAIVTVAFLIFLLAKLQPHNHKSA